jgi:hypothetical protein
MLYTLEPIWKKSYVEVEHWYKEINGKKMWIERYVGFRWGKCIFESDEKPDIDLKNESSFNITDEVEDPEYEADDSCWVDFIFPKTLTEELCEETENMDFEELEENGWQLDDIECYITGPMKLTDENGNEWRGD